MGLGLGSGPGSVIRVRVRGASPPEEQRGTHRPGRAPPHVSGRKPKMARGAARGWRLPAAPTIAVHQQRRPHEPRTGRSRGLAAQRLVEGELRVGAEVGAGAEAGAGVGARARAKLRVARVRASGPWRGEGEGEGDGSGWQGDIGARVGRG